MNVLLAEKDEREQLHDMYNMQGLTAFEIGKNLGVSHPTILARMRKYGLSRRRSGLTNRVKITHSPEMSYMLGVLFGDGWITKKDFRMEVNNDLFRQSFSDVCRKIGFKPLHYQRLRKYGMMYSSISCSKQFCDWYNSLSTKEMLDFASHYFKEFIRGMFESEGHFRKRINGGVEVLLTNSDLDVLKQIGLWLNSSGYNTSITKNSPCCVSHITNIQSKQVYNLNILGDKNKKTEFVSWLNPCIKTSPRLTK